MTGLAVTAVVAVACLIFGFLAFMGWLVTCTGPFYESGCDRSGNSWLNLGFLATAIVLIAGAALTIALVFRLLMRWTTPEADRPPLGRHAMVVAVLAVVAFFGVMGGTAIADAMREPSAWQEQNRQVSEQRRQDEDAMCGLVAVGDFAGAHQAAVGSDESMMDLVRPLSDLAAYRAGDDLRLVMNAAEHVNVRCRNGTWRQIAALVDPPIPQADLDAATAAVATVLADVCAAAGDAQFGVAQRILDEAVVLPGLNETLGALHDRIARSGEPEIIERWIDGIRENWCPNLPATEDLLTQWVATHRSLYGRFMIAPTRQNEDPCIEMSQRGILGADLTIYGPDGVVGVGRLTHGDGVGPLDDLRCWVSPDTRIPIEIADTYQLVAGGTELATFTDDEVVASGGDFDLPIALEPVEPSTPGLLRPYNIAGASIAHSGHPLSSFDAVLGNHHFPQTVDDLGPPQTVEWPQHGLSISISHQTQGYTQLDGWEYRSGPSMEFATDEGITIRSSYDDLTAAYGTRLLWSQPRPECGEGWIFTIGDDRIRRIEGLLDGTPEPTSRVERLWSGDAFQC